MNEIEQMAQENEPKTQKRKIRLVAAFAATAVIACAVGYCIGNNSAVDAVAVKDATTAKLGADEQYAEITQKIADAETQLADKKETLNKLKGFISDKQDVYDKMQDYEANEATYNQLISDAQAKLDGIDAQLADYDSQINAKQSELDRLTTGIAKAKESPVSLPAGELTVGTDIQPGRYSVTGKSNFIVHSMFGELKVNTILGGGSFGVAEYVCTLETGDKIKAGSRCTYTPIK